MVGVPYEPVAVGAAVVSVLATLLTSSVRLSRLSVLAAAPWAVAAAGAVVAGRAGAYGALDPAPSGTALAAAVVAVAAVCWVGFSGLAAARDVGHRERYLAASGGTAAAVLVAALLGSAASTTAVRVSLLAVGPIAAGLLAAGGYFLLGLVYTDPVAELRLAGLYTVAAVVLDGIASAAVLAALGGEETGLLTLGFRAGLGAAGVDLPVTYLLPGHLLGGLLAVSVCARLARWRSAVGNACALAVSAVALCSGATVLLSAVVLG